MRKRLLGLAVITGAFIATIVPAGAGPYSFRFGTAQATILKGQLHGGGTVTAYLMKSGLEPATSAATQAGAISGGGELQVLPAPVNQEVPTIDSNYAGCIRVKTRKGTDYGCELLPPSTLDFDALMTKGYVTFAVESIVAPGRRIVANLQMTGLGTAPSAPSADCKDPAGKPCSRNEVTPRLACPAAPCTEAPYKIGSGQTLPVWFYGFKLEAQDVLARDTAVVGSIRSEHVGGGGIASTSVSRVFYGVNGGASYQVDCLVRLGTCRT